MLKRCPPKSNLQRQREFRARNPHYYRDLHRKRKAREQALAKVRAEHPELTLDQAYDLLNAPARTKTAEKPIEVAAPLALPATAESHTTTVTVPLPSVIAYDPIPINLLVEPEPKRRADAA